MLSITPGERIVVRDSRGREHDRIALTNVVQGRDIPVVWAARVDEWDAARRENREPEAVPWPATDVRRAEP